MSAAIKELHDFLSISPSVVYPQDVLEFLPAIEAENAKLRELVADMYKAFMHGACYKWCEFKEPCNYISDGRCQWYDRGHELGVEVDG